MGGSVVNNWYKKEWPNVCCVLNVMVNCFMINALAWDCVDLL